MCALGENTSFIVALNAHTPKVTQTFFIFIDWEINQK